MRRALSSREKLRHETPGGHPVTLCECEQGKDSRKIEGLLVFQARRSCGFAATSASSPARGEGDAKHPSRARSGDREACSRHGH